MVPARYIGGLDERLAGAENADVHRVFENLKFGSESHLLAFATNIEIQTGETYVPQYMVQADYDATVDASGPVGGRMGGCGGRLQGAPARHWLLPGIQEECGGIP